MFDKITPIVHSLPLYLLTQCAHSNIFRKKKSLIRTKRTEEVSQINVPISTHIHV